MSKNNEGKNNSSFIGVVCADPDNRLYKDKVSDTRNTNKTLCCHR